MKEKALLNLVMETCMLEILNRVNYREKEYFIIKTEIWHSHNGKTIKNKGKAI